MKFLGECTYMSFAYLIWTSLEKVERKSIILIPEKNNSCYVLNTQKIHYFVQQISPIVTFSIQVLMQLRQFGFMCKLKQCSREFAFKWAVAINNIYWLQKLFKGSSYSYETLKEKAKQANELNNQA